MKNSRQIFIVSMIFTLLATAQLLGEETTVYVTETGTKYHIEACSYLSSSKIAISLEDAMAQIYGPCSRCNPPTLIPTGPLSITVVSPEKERIALPYFEEGDAIFFYSGFTLKYNEEYEQAEWVAYLLTDDEVSDTFERSDNFRADSAVPTGSASLADYRGSGYDRGHLAPAADMKWSEEAMDESFLMSNMSPQEPGFNRGIWKALEGLVRNWAVDNGEVYVVTGPVLTDGPYETIGENNVAIPKRYYKVILDYKEPEMKAIGFILPNKKIYQPIAMYSVSVDAIEEATGLDFFHILPEEIEEQLEAQATFSKWEN